MKSLGFLLILTAPLYSQITITPDSTPATAYQVDCRTMPDAPRACASYNELVQAKDADLTSLLDRKEVYVCFREGADIFYLVALDTPIKGAFHKAPTGGYQASGIVTYARFEDGQSDDYRTSFGTWRKFLLDDTPNFSADGPRASLEASESEISVAYDYKNVAGGITNYTLQIRRSTFRAKETLEWKNPPKDEKKGQGQRRETGSLQYDGRCTSY